MVIHHLSNGIKSVLISQRYISDQVIVKAKQMHSNVVMRIRITTKFT